MTTLRAMLSFAVVCTLVSSSVAQTDRKDRAVFVDPKNEFYDTLKAASERLATKDKPPQKELRMDFSGVNIPASANAFSRAWHNAPVSQGISGMCWCFSATSYFESEVYRLSNRKIKLSELYTVYWEYVEKARRYVRERGNSEFGQGSEANAVPRIWKMYGVVPADAYTGLLNGRKYHDHDPMFAEMRAYLTTIRNTNAWNEDEVLATIRAILNHYIGDPPANVVIEGKTLTPKEYLNQVVRLKLDDYVEFMSLMQKPYYQQVEYEVSDNWWHNKEYHNVPLDEFMAIIKKAVRKGYTLCIGGDTSEPGLEGHAGVAMIPTFDIPSAFIDESARQFRFSNGTTGDDHGIHLVGYQENGGKDWYLIKDSGSGSRNNAHPGYYYYHEDFVKLKMLGITVHKSMVEDLLKKFK